MIFPCPRRKSFVQIARELDLHCLGDLAVHLPFRLGVHFPLGAHLLIGVFGSLGQAFITYAYRN